MDSSSDEERIVILVMQAKEGSHIAFGRLFHLYSDAVYKYLRHMIADDEAARDLMQETFIKVWESLHTLRNPACFRRWLYRIAKNKACNYIRHNKVISWQPWGDDDISGYGDGLAEKPDEWVLLRLALGQVQPTYRQCLILQEIDDFSQNEIAEIVGIKKSSVSQYVKRGYEELDRAYQRLDSIKKTFLERGYSL